MFGVLVEYADNGITLPEALWPRVLERAESTMRSAALIALAILGTTTGLAQDSYTIAQPLINSCQASFQDTGGEPGGGYQNNENLTSTICPDAPGFAISLNFGATPFNLSTAGAAPLDQITIYDGDDITAPPIGTWSGSDSPGVITASFANPTGCLTVTFTSNATGTGRFAAFISCSVPCEPPVAIASITGSTESPALVCQNEVLTFDASASTAASGFNIAEYKWVFDDGTVDSLSGPIVEHSFSVPGEYVVQVYLTDDNDCASTNLVDLQLLVSTTPIFSETSISDTTVCQGQPVILDATGVFPITWSAIPEANFGDGIYLPDDQSQPFNSTLTFGGFSPNATLENIADLESICVSMEHSYMGDLVIFVTCPNGQNVYFHQQGGGSTFIGNALDGETEPPTPGECLDYCWEPNATNGTWADNATFGTTLPTGSYESVQPMNQLVGCPLNGTWTFTVNDLFGADDGFLCSWEINFDPSLYPDLTEYTPDLGLSTLDSANWAGANVVVDPQTPLIAVVNTPQPGVFDYVFSVTDNFGCTYDTTMTVTVTPSPQAPIIITGDEVICEDGIAYLVAPSGFDSYLWNPGNATGTNVNVQAGTYTVTVAFGNCPLTSDPFTVSLAPNPVPIITGPQFSCGGVPVTLTTEDEYVSYNWSNNSQSPSVSVGSGNWFVTVTNEFGCSGTSASYPVTVAQDPVAAFGTNPLSPQPVTTTVDFTDASTASGGNIETWFWDFDDEENTSSAQNPSYTFNDPGTYDVLLVVTTADGCIDSTIVSYVIFPPDILIPNVFTPNGDDLNETFSIENLEFYQHELRIYSRWGTLVHESTNASRPWRAGDQPDGTYYYVLTLEDGRELAGHVTVLR